jgi:hypothetical protein
MDQQATIRALENNVRLLATTFEVLKALIQEKKTWTNGVEVSNLANLHWAAKYVYERYEAEKAKLVPRKHFIENTPLHSTLMGTKSFSVESTMLYLEIMSKSAKESLQ